LVEQRAPASDVETPAADAEPQPVIEPTIGGELNQVAPPAAPIEETPALVIEDRAPEPVPARPAPPLDRSLKILYICTANICRSPFMELLSRQLVGPRASLSFSSAGTHGYRAEAMDADMAATLVARGVPGIRSFRSRAFTGDMMLHADLVLTATTTHRQFILDDHPAAFRQVLTLGQFAQAVRGVGPAASGRDLIAAVAERRGTADPAVDVPDPYRRGPEAAEACAASIEDLLRVVLPALTGSRKITA
jgi:sulfate adenylyltransferase